MAMAMEEVQLMDPETAFLASKQETGNEWELFKENVKPLKRGRNVKLLNDALKSNSDHHLRKSLLDKRRNFIKAIDDYQGDDPLQPWIECIKWVQEAFPPGGDCSGLVVIYEQCVRTFWHEDHYRDDLRYLKVWLEYAENCVDAEVVYSFLDANKIGQTHAIFYKSYALHLESKNKIKTANEIYNLGINRNAQPIEKLNAAYMKFIARSMGRPKESEEEVTENRDVPIRSFGTLLARGENRTIAMESSDVARKKLKQDRANGVSLAIYKDTNTSTTLGHQTELSSSDSRPWRTLAARAERNKENNAVPAKWTSAKIPQRPGHRIGVVATTPCIEVFVDEECTESNKVEKEGGNSSTLQLRNGNSQDLKKETELLRENPLRHFPASSMPR